MRVHLVYPNFMRGRAGGMQEPLGILYLASALRQAGRSHEQEEGEQDAMQGRPALKEARSFRVLARAPGSVGGSHIPTELRQGAARRRALSPLVA